MCTLVSIQKSLGWGKEISGVGVNRIIVCRFNEGGGNNDGLALLSSCKIGESNSIATISFDLSHAPFATGEEWPEKAKNAMNFIAKTLCGEDVKTSYEDGVMNINETTDKVVIYSFTVKSLINCNAVTLTASGRTLKTRKWAEFSTVSREQAFEKCQADAEKQLKAKNWKPVTEDKDED